MIMRKSAHKDLDNPAGQMKDIDPDGIFAKAQYEHDIKPEYFSPPKKLGDIIDRVNKQENIKQYRYITFDEWYNTATTFDHFTLCDAFYAAREMV